MFRRLYRNINTGSSIRGLNEYIRITYCTTKIISYLSDGTQSIGTGFFMNFNVNSAKNSYQPVVLTNKHVIAGATKVEMSICKADDNNNPKDT